MIANVLHTDICRLPYESIWLDNLAKRKSFEETSMDISISSYTSPQGSDPLYIPLYYCIERNSKYDGGKKCRKNFAIFIYVITGIKSSLQSKCIYLLGL